MWPEGLASREVVRTLEAKAIGSKSVGIHVHIGWSRELPAETLARLVTIAAYLEKGLYAITGTKSRERGHYCGGVRKYGNDKDAKPALDHNRYHALNLTGLARGTRETVEFRVFSGSLNPTKILGWIQVCLGLVERAMNGKRSPKWTPAPLKGGWKKAGEGQSEAERLLGYLAWGAGYARIHHGQQYGWISDMIAGNGQGRVSPGCRHVRRAPEPDDSAREEEPCVVSSDSSLATARAPTWPACGAWP